MHALHGFPIAPYYQLLLNIFGVGRAHSSLSSTIERLAQPNRFENIYSLLHLDVLLLRRLQSRGYECQQDGNDDHHHDRIEKDVAITVAFHLFIPLLILLQP